MRDAGGSPPVGTTTKQEEEEGEDQEEGGEPQPGVHATEAEVAAKTTEGDSEKAAGEPTEEPRKVEKSAETAEPADEDWVKL